MNSPYQSKINYYQIIHINKFQILSSFNLLKTNFIIYHAKNQKFRTRQFQHRSDFR